MHFSHSSHMEPSKPARVVLAVLGAFMLVAWALIIWVATVVTQTALETLQYIIDLAQLT
jgi:predicted metal-binding membrane protein